MKSLWNVVSHSGGATHMRLEVDEIGQSANPLETDSVGRLILKHSFPAIVSSLMGSVYNIVDFVGNGVGKCYNRWNPK